MLLEHLVPQRSCGECVVCCEILRINEPELKKEPGILCKHCTGSGCGIYNTRPSVCRTWYCLWRRIDALPDELRPDLCGFVVSIETQPESANPFERAYVVVRSSTDRMDFTDSDAFRGTVEMFAEEGSLPVWLSSGDNKSLIYPGPELRDAIMRPYGTPYKDHIANAMRLRKLWNL